MFNTSKNIEKYKTALILLLFCLPFFSSAASAPDTTNISSILQNIVDLLTGTIATYLGIISIILLGFAAMFGMFDMRKAGFVILGIVLVFSAAWIFESISGKKVAINDNPIELKINYV